MKKYTVANLLAAFTLPLMFSGIALAGDLVSLNITGNVVASPCIANGGNASLDVDLGNIQATNLFTPGSSGPVVNFDLKFTECPAGTNNVTVSFSGTPDPGAGSDYYKNTGTATNVAVKLIQASTGNAVGTGKTITQPVLSDRTVTVSLQAQAYSSAGGAMPGTISSVVTTTFTYQ